MKLSHLVRAPVFQFPAPWFVILAKVINFPEIQFLLFFNVEKMMESAWQYNTFTSSLGIRKAALR